MLGSGWVYTYTLPYLIFALSLCKNLLNPTTSPSLIRIHQNFSCDLDHCNITGLNPHYIVIQDIPRTKMQFKKNSLFTVQHNAAKKRERLYAKYCSQN